MLAVRKTFLHLASNRIFVILIAALIAGMLAFRVAQSAEDNQYRLRALAIANATAAMPQVIDLLTNGDPQHQIPIIAESIRKKTDATYVVIADRSGIRLSHPNPALIGKRLDGQLPALRGISSTSIDIKGTLGRSANGKTPIFDRNNKVVGMVSAGILQSKFAADNTYLRDAFIYYGLGFILFGFLFSEVLARRLKGQRIALELERVTSKYQEHDAMLHAIKEGVITLTTQGKITLINDEALRLLNLHEGVLGKRIGEVLLPGRLLDLLLGQVQSGDDELVLNENFSLRVNRRPVRQMGRDIGAVITFRDRTEHIGLLRDLDSVRSLTDALRAQQHEYSNRMHTLNGLIELGRYEEASEYLGEISTINADLAETLHDNIVNPTITALLIAKVSIARERGVNLSINAEVPMNDFAIDQNALITIVGNLLDNAIDATTGSKDAKVEISITSLEGPRKLIRVHDTGRGLPDPNPEVVFKDGYSTKPSRSGSHRGLGLAIVQRLVRQADGEIGCFNQNGATFVVELPTTSNMNEMAIK
jgi:two-component system CitB family sensor kinase